MDYPVRCEKAEQNRPCGGEIVKTIYDAPPTMCPTRERAEEGGREAVMGDMPSEIRGVKI
jgi:hypothetical protein